MSAAFDASASSQLPNGGQHPPCAPNVADCVDMHFVAHQDDDLLFMNPDIATSIAYGNHVVSVFLTAGTAVGEDEFEPRLIEREIGILNAYAYMVDPFYSATERDDQDAMLAYWQLHDGAPITISTSYGTKQAIQYDFIGNSSFPVSIVSSACMRPTALPICARCGTARTRRSPPCTVLQAARWARRSVPRHTHATS
jgi:hypothetical protein